MIDGNTIDGVVKTFFSVRHATPDATGQSLTCASASTVSAVDARARPTTVIDEGDPEAERERLRVPAGR